MALDLQQAYEESKDYPHQMGRIIARSWVDPQFKAALIANPAQVLRQNGIPVPPTMHLTAGEAAPGSTYHIPLPPRPPEVTDEQLSGVAADDSSCAGTVASLSCPCCSVGTASSAHG
jgi:hypothetical protein